MKYQTKIINKGNTIYSSDTNYKRLLEYSRENSMDGARILILNNDFGDGCQEYVNKKGKLFAQR